MKLHYGQQTQKTRDEQKTVEHTCPVCNQTFFAAPDAFLSHGWCDQCYVRLKTAEMKVALGLK